MTLEEKYLRAFENGYRRTVSALLRWGCPYNLVDDIVQSAYLRAWERLEQCQSDDIVPWVRCIALNMLRDEIRRASRLRNLLPEHDQPTQLNEKRIEAELAIRRSGPSQEKLLRRVYLDEEPKARVAIDLGISIPALEKRLSRAMDVVRKNAA
jgi:RNA polymerase sigma factor (sigma-70 family)